MNATTIKIGATNRCPSVRIISDAMGIMSSNGASLQVIEWAAKTNQPSWQASLRKAEGISI